MNRTATIVAGLSLAFVGTSTTYAATYSVCNSGCDYTSIQDAIDVATDGSTINVHAGTYYESNLKIEGKSVTIQGAGTDATIINANAHHRCMEIKGSATDSTLIQDLTLTNGSTLSDGSQWNGGGIWVNSDASIHDVKIFNCVAYNYGGGIYIEGGSPTIDSCQIEANRSNGSAYAGGQARGGGIYCTTAAAPVIQHSTINNNTAEYSSGRGGGIHCTATQGIMITICDIHDNVAPNGSAIYGNGSAELTFDDCSIAGSGSNLLHNAHDADSFMGGTPDPIHHIEFANCVICAPSPDHVKGLFHYVGGNHISDCLDDADVEQDGDVDIADLVAMRAALGLCKSDVDSDYDTDVMDLLWVIDGWGGICP